MPALELPSGAPTLVEAFAQKKPTGATPTLPALEGALQAASATRAHQPETKAIVLLATDGLPTACDPAIPGPNVLSAAGIPKVVAAAQAGLERGVQTFVIGVFAPDEQQIAQQNLDAIAIAGGSDAAYVIATSEHVGQRFLQTLGEIRAAANACSYALPKPDGTPIDANRISVRIGGPSGTLWLEPVGSFAECHPTLGGFVYDRDPRAGEIPSRIELCPQSCNLLDADPALSLELVIDCRS